MVALLPSSAFTYGWVWIRPSAWEWIPAFAQLGWGCRPASRNAGAGSSHSPADVDVERGCASGRRPRWRPGSGRGADRCPALSLLPRVSMDSDDADDDDNGDGDVPAERSAPPPLRLAVLGPHGGAPDNGSGTGAWRVAGYPLTLGAAGARPEGLRRHLHHDAARSGRRRQGRATVGEHHANGGSRNRYTPTGGAPRSCGTGGARCSRPCTWSTSPPGSYEILHPMWPSRQQRSRSSMYMK